MLKEEPMIETRLEEPGLEPRRPRSRFRFLKLGLILLVVLLLIGAVVVWGITTRVQQASTVKERTLELAIPTVSVAHPKLGAKTNEIVLPGNIQAFTDSPIYARASGYLKKWYVDIGGRVKAGQLLAEIDAPEIDQQVAQAKATVQQTQASLQQAQAAYQQGKSNEDLARVTAQRWSSLQAKGVVSRQENDQYQAQYKAQTANLQALEQAIAAARGNVASAQANLARLQQLQDYKMVKAPFDGVITARNTDVGALVNAGNGGPAQELFHMAATSKLRVFVNVPQAYARSAVPGVIADLTLPEFGGRRFPGKLVRTAESIDSMRTLLTEVDVDNASGDLLPGSYAEVHLKLREGAPSLIVPVNALIFRSEGMRIGVVRNGKAELVPVTLGKDYGTEVEVTSGLNTDDSIVVNPPDSLTSGMAVHVSTANSSY